jgi:hypothetical protein
MSMKSICLLVVAMVATFTFAGCRATPSRASASTNSSANALHVVAPYKYKGMWVFDDARVGLHREPFVSGIDTMIDKLVEKIPDADKGFRLIFSDQPFPGYNVRLERRRTEHGGNWYYSPELGMEGWLCPALFKYYEQAPKQLYGKAEPKG